MQPGGEEGRLTVSLTWAISGLGSCVNYWRVLCIGFIPFDGEVGAIEDVHELVKG